MSNQIPGVPEGWELVAIRKPIAGVEYILSPQLGPELCDNEQTRWNRCIIRKIEKPATYRPFKDAEEYMPHWGKPIRTKGSHGFDSVVSTGQIGVYIAAGSMIARYSMADAFKRFEFADGSPFGVRIDE